MKKPAKPIVPIASITELHRILGIREPEHPQVSIVYFSEIVNSKADFTQGFVLDFYMVAAKRDFNGKVRYGQHYYDFDEGVMSFVAPGQLCYEDEPTDRPANGFMLLFHQDFIQGYALGKNIKHHEYFSYEANEALYVSKKEEVLIEQILSNIASEYHGNIDRFTQDVIVSHIELLLNYCNRFYNRQFITRKQANNDLIAKLEQLLNNHLNAHDASLPKVKDLADQLNVSPGYLSDMLRAHTGQNAQQHIHNKLIDKAKEILTTTELTVSEVAYRLGFEYPQSFSKLFKAKANVSPLEYRRLFN
ncbi:helix-turn-helix domain-containing protein [Flavobacterium sp. RHBU_24]|uniref:helix-turn-helix domain-containing protein n=1 Tax=Flavobacterium sp. RHBU_24 TaxID=3391185 RepID=UPI0039849E42